MRISLFSIVSETTKEEVFFHWLPYTSLKIPPEEPEVSTLSPSIIDNQVFLEQKFLILRTTSEHS